MSDSETISRGSKRRDFLRQLVCSSSVMLLKAQSAQPELGAMKEYFNVRTFGASGDGHTLDTKAIQAAIDSCHNSGGGTVYFPPTGTFRTGTVYLKDHVNLHVATNATILGSESMADYGTDTGVSSYYPEPLDRCLIYAKEATDIQLSGNGSIIGRVTDGADKRRLPQPVPGAQGRESAQRPTLIRFENCSKIGISGLSLQHCWAWCVHLKDSRDIFLRNVRIDNDWQDGFHLESSQNIAISDCHLVCGDDAIALTTSSLSKPVRNLTVTNCLLRSRWAGIRFGPLSKGNFEDIAVSNCVIYDCNGGGIKLGMYEGAEIRNILFENIVMDQVTAPISIFLGTWPEIGSTSANPSIMPLGKIHGLQFRGIRAISKLAPPGPRPDENSGMFFQGHPHSFIEDVVLSDVQISFAGGGTAVDARRRDIIDMDQIDYRTGGYWTDNKNVWGIPPAYGLYARHLRGLTLDRVRFDLIQPDLRPPAFCSDCEDIEISHLKAACSENSAMLVVRNGRRVDLSFIAPLNRAGQLLLLEGGASSGVTLFDYNSKLFAELVEYADSARQEAVTKK